MSGAPDSEDAPPCAAIQGETASWLAHEPGMLRAMRAGMAPNESIERIEGDRVHQRRGRTFALLSALAAFLTFMTLVPACAPDASPKKRAPSSASPHDDDGESEATSEEEIEAAEANVETASSEPPRADPPDATAPPPAVGSRCAGKDDGTKYDEADPAGRCCASQETKVDTADNCGGCGIKCPSGFGCGKLPNGAFGCNCVSTASCKGASYGQDATCHTTDEGTFCNCQCPNGETTCKGVCAGGATCHDVPGQNYCAYD